MKTFVRSSIIAVMAGLLLGGTAPAVLNAANEAAVARFLQEKIGFTDIPRIIGETLDKAEIKPYAYVHLNKARTHAGFVFTRDKEKWTVEEKPDYEFDSTQDCYIAPFEIIQWAELPSL